MTDWQQHDIFGRDNREAARRVSYANRATLSPRMKEDVCGGGSVTRQNCCMHRLPLGADSFKPSLAISCVCLSGATVRVVAPIARAEQLGIKQDDRQVRGRAWTVISDISEALRYFGCDDAVTAPLRRLRRADSALISQWLSCDIAGRTDWPASCDVTLPVAAASISCPPAGAQQPRGPKIHVCW